MRRPQLHRANNHKTWSSFDEEEERPSPYEPNPMVPHLGSTAELLMPVALRTATDIVNGLASRIAEALALAVVKA
jgi:hypothetical protein